MPKTYSYLTGDKDENKKVKAQKSVIKMKFKFKDSKYCLEATQLENKINQPQICKPNVDK